MQVMLAKDIEDVKSRSYIGWYASEKLDGMRCYWDGVGATGEKVKGRPVTGFFSRYGNVISVPKRWVEEAPKGVKLDGELWCGRENRQKLLATTKDYYPSKDWDDVEFHVFESPGSGKLFKDTYQYLLSLSLSLSLPPFIKVVEQTILESSEHQGMLLKAVIAKGGEGLMLRNPYSYYQNTRSSDLVKVKNKLMGRATVIGFTRGKGKYSGMIGALTVMWNNVVFDISGMVDSERVIGSFNDGDKVMFQYCGLSTNGVPQEARYKGKAE